MSKDEIRKISLRELRAVHVTAITNRTASSAVNALWRRQVTEIERELVRRARK
jgi:hypothetical protein